MSDTTKQSEHPSPPTAKEQGYFLARYFVVTMSFLGITANYMIRNNLNIAILEMVKQDNETENSTNPCNFDDEEDETDDYGGDFDWDELTQSMILSAYYWGYIWTQIPGGRLAEYIGAKRIFGTSVLLASILILFIPVTANWGSGPLIALRFLMGLILGPCFPSNHALLSEWAPPLERSIMSTIIYIGMQGGTIITYPFTAFIINNRGWEAVFYIQGSIAIVWVIFWFLLVSDKPENQRWISQAEKDYLRTALAGQKSKKKAKLPWKAIWTSLPFWAILLTHMGVAWSYYTLLAELPLFMSSMLLLDINSNALFSTLPQVGLMLFSLFFGAFGDKLRQKGFLTTIQLRKLAASIATFGAAMCLFALTFIECNRGWVIALFILSSTLQGAGNSSYMVNHLDIAPNFAATLFGITNSFASVSGSLAPLTVGILVNDNQTFEQWDKVWYIATIISVVVGIFYLIFASGTVQHWNNRREDDAYSDKEDDSKTS